MSPYNNNNKGRQSPAMMAAFSVDDLATVFSQFDINRDGLISTKELRNALQASGLYSMMQRSATPLSFSTEYSSAGLSIDTTESSSMAATSLRKVSEDHELEHKEIDEECESDHDDKVYSQSMAETDSVNQRDSVHDIESVGHNESDYDNKVDYFNVSEEVFNGDDDDDDDDEHESNGSSESDYNNGTLNDSENDHQNSEEKFSD